MYALSIPELDEKGGSVAIQCCQFISQRYNIKMENKIKDLHSLLFGDVTIDYPMALELHVDHELPDNIRSGYYDYASGEKSFCTMVLFQNTTIARDMRISCTLNLSIQTEAAVDIKNYREAANELKLIEDEIARVASQIRKLKQTATKCEGNLCSFKQKAEKYKNAFQELVDAPW
ncbi:hypothetical protein Tco_1022330 [Tanacetum coccineum]